MRAECVVLVSVRRRYVFERDRSVSTRVLLHARALNLPNRNVRLTTTTPRACTPRKQRSRSSAKFALALPNTVLDKSRSTWDVHEQRVAARAHSVGNEEKKKKIRLKSRSDGSRSTPHSWFNNDPYSSAPPRCSSYGTRVRNLASESCLELVGRSSGRVYPGGRRSDSFISRVCPVSRPWK